MKQYKIFFTVSLLVIMAVCCSPDENNSPLTDDGTVPDPVTNPQVENLAGAAKITYELPANENLLYVMAVYDLKGAKTEVKASLYKNHLIVEGFGDTNEHEVMLHAVSRSEKVSEGVKVTVKPLTPPVQVIKNSLVVGETFGGIFVNYQNLHKANVVIKILIEDLDTKEWINIDNHYTSLDSGQFATRGLTPVERNFKLFVKDRWDNISDTLLTTKTPVYEEELDKSDFKDMRKKNYPVPQIAPLPGSGEPLEEIVDYNGTYKFNRIFDDNTGNFFHSKEKYDQPAWLPFDLGVKATLSRFKIWQRKGNSFNYQHGNPHKWEIWGTNDINDVNSWVKLGSFTMIKPSGLPDGQLSSEDNEALNNGHEFEFPIGIPAVRYVAYKHIDAWSTQEGEKGFLHIAEMSVWGQKQ